MHNKKRDFLTISMAMLTVLLCGFGLGHLVGEKKGQQKQSNADPPVELSDNWAAQAITRLEKQLNLSPEQLTSAREKIAPISRTLEKDLRELRGSRTRHLLQFYQSLKPQLDHQQKIELERLEKELSGNHEL